MSKYRNKKVVIVGLGLSGVAVAKFMTQQKAHVVISDLKKKEELTTFLEACQGLSLEYELGGHQLESFLSADLIVVSPGVPLNLPILDEVRQKNIPITNEIELAVQSITQPILAVTGTNGKTTTTHLIGAILKADQKKVFVGGNLGKPLLDFVIDPSARKEIELIVLELSSFQLDLVESLIPKVAVFTNIEADHLDRYGNLDTYIQSKKRLLTLCTKESFVVLNQDNQNLIQFKEEAVGPTLSFFKKSSSFKGSAQGPGDFAYYDLKHKQITVQLGGKHEVYDISQFRLFGEHNRENLTAAIAATRLLGASSQAIQSVIENFSGVPHRLEFVRKKEGVFFINDSKGTNVASVQRSLASFNTHPIILIAGGKDKGADFTSLIDLVKKNCKILILVGEAKEKINRALGDYAETYLVGTFEEAILLGYQKSRRGDIVLLSPGCASYDLFKNYEERGDTFKRLVSEL